MRRIVTAVSAAALALSLVAQAVPAAAVTGYDSAYSGESAFLTLAPGQSGTFTVFFANTSPNTTWTKGTATQVDLAACLEDKVTCDQQDASEAPYNPTTNGWLSATRYATTTQSSVAPGQIGTFTYNVAVPSTGSGLHRFNGDLVVSSMGAAGKVHPEGYYQDVQVSGTTATGTGITVTPSDKAINTFSTAAGTSNENRGIRTYTATLGTDIIAPVRILVWAPSCFNGGINFNDSDGDRKADQSSCSANNSGVFIEDINGLSLGGAQTNVEASPPAGSNKITFSFNVRLTANTATQTGTFNRQAIPVVFKDTNGDSLLDVNTKPCCGAADTNTSARAVTGAGDATEPVGVGGEKDWTGEAATLGSFSCNGTAATTILGSQITNEGRVRFIDTTTGYADITYGSNTTTAANGTGFTENRFNFKATDSFFYVNSSGDAFTAGAFGAQGAGLSFTQFKAMLTTRSRMTVNYNPAADAPSVWTFCANRPARPSSATASITAAPSTTGGIPKESAQNCVVPANPGAGDCITGTALNVTGASTTTTSDTQAPDTVVDDVVVTFPVSGTACVKGYYVNRETSTDNGINWNQTEVVTGNARIVNTTDTTVTVYDLSVPAGFHRWRVVSVTDDPNTTLSGTSAIIDCGNSGSATIDRTAGTAANDNPGGAIDDTATSDLTGSTRAGSSARTSNTLTTTVPSGAASGRPQSTDMFVSTSGGLNGQLDTGDVFKIVFNQVMNSDSTGKVIQFKDSDGTVMVLRCTPPAVPPAGEYTATCNFNVASETVKGAVLPANRVATVTITGTTLPASTSSAAGTTAGEQYPAVVVDSGGWNNTASPALSWDLASSPDVTLEQP